MVNKLDGFYSTYIDIFFTIDDALSKGRGVSCLILLYSAIDSFSYLAERDITKKGRSVFKSWVKKWVLEKYPLPCNENDLYGARCGLLHAQISESDISTSGECLEIYYVWGNQDAQKLQFIINHTRKKDSVVAVKIEELIQSVKNGMGDCFIEISKDKDWQEIFEEKALRLFSNVNHSDTELSSVSPHSP